MTTSIISSAGCGTTAKTEVIHSWPPLCRKRRWRSERRSELFLRNSSLWFPPFRPSSTSRTTQSCGEVSCLGLSMACSSRPLSSLLSLGMCSTPTPGASHSQKHSLTGSQQSLRKPPRCLHRRLDEHLCRRTWHRPPRECGCVAVTKPRGSANRRRRDHPHRVPPWCCRRPRFSESTTMGANGVWDTGHLGVCNSRCVP